MDVINVLYLSIDNNTAHFHDRLGSRRACTETGFGSKNGHRTTEKQRSVVPS